MPSLKDYRDRIQSVKSTRKITSAMKMVAASKLKKAQEAAEASEPYARAMRAMMARVAAGVAINDSGPRLLVGTGRDHAHLLVVVTASRGLCGGFNSNLVRLARKEISRLQDEGKNVRLVCIGRKGRDALRRDFEELIVKSFVGLGGREGISFRKVDEITRFILARFEEGQFDICSLIHNQFKNVLVQIPSTQQLIPLPVPTESGEPDAVSDRGQYSAAEQRYGFEPEESILLAQLLPKNLGAQLYQALLDSAAGEQAARMTAMDNATSAAGDMIDDLTLQYNRERQSVITKELIEVVSGAEAT